MAEEKPKKPSYAQELARFYFAPELRSLVTLLYLGVFGYFSLYYMDNLTVAIRYLIHVTFGHTALLGISHLFIGMIFLVSLAFPFFLSIYSIFVLHKVWDKPQWATYIKWLVTFVMIIGGILLIIGADQSARWAARQHVMQSFVEDANLTGRI
ncbi:MAG: hypothetical protein RLZZ67_627 [Candidatus Parcubacteria bacterium]|jgi:hypothetical protein